MCLIFYKNDNAGLSTYTTNEYVVKSYWYLGHYKLKIWISGFDDVTNVVAGVIIKIKSDPTNGMQYT